jgi:hypothetical protein
MSCTEGPVGIFASIAAETDINKYATPAFKSASPAFVAKLGTSYYAGIGELYTRGETATSWTKASTNGLPGTGPFLRHERGGGRWSLFVCHLCRHFNRYHAGRI